METSSQKLKYDRAKSRVQELKAFYIMAFGYCILIPFLIFLNLKMTPNFHWFWFPAFGCGISILFYAFNLFAGKSWEEKKIKELVDKDPFKN